LEEKHSRKRNREPEEKQRAAGEKRGELEDKHSRKRNREPGEKREES
jgi:hypothetical protein